MDRFFLLALMLIYSTFTQAASYVLDKNPRLKYPEIGGKTGYSNFLKKPIDKNVCRIFVDNWNFLISQKTTISTGQPVSNKLDGKIKKANWTDLDPKENLILFRNLISENNIDPIPPGDVSDKVLASFSARVARGDLLFRKGKYEFPSGADSLKNESNLTDESKKYFEIIQYGQADTSQRIANPYRRSSDLFGNRVLIAAEDDLHQIRGTLNDTVGLSAQNIWIINSKPYAEFITYSGDLVLSEIELDPTVYLNPVCLLHYKK